MTCRYCPRCIDAGSLGILVELVPLIAVDHLDDLRHLLRDDGRWSGLTEAQRLLRADLLDQVSRRLVDELGRDSASLVAVGDMHPTAPDTAAGAELP